MSKVIDNLSGMNYNDLGKSFMGGVHGKHRKDIERETDPRANEAE